MRFGHYIGGEWIGSENWLPVFDKYSGEEIGLVGKANREIVSLAIEDAERTFHKTKLSELERYEVLMKAAGIIQQRQDTLSQLLICEAGKTYKDASAEIERGIQTLIASAEEAKRIHGDGIPLNLGQGQHRVAFTLRVPVGVIAAITPFNYPFNLVMHKVAPALAAGNTVVLKPTQNTPFIACELVNIFTEAGLPAGFLNLVNGTGRETGSYLLEDSRISMYTFTGSSEVGRQIKNKTGIRKVALELGNNSPNIVHHDAPDLMKAAELCVRRGFANAGQACISVQNVYVHQSVYEAFLKHAVHIANSLKVGDPKLPDTDIGPMISEKEAARAEQWIQEAASQGATIETGGHRHGAILQPTILADVTPSMKVVCEEIFAPVISIMKYEDIDSLFFQINQSKLGLQVGLFTSNLQLALQGAQQLQFGGVIVNDVSTYRTDVMPYGGIKDSGIGKEGPRYAIQEMTDERLVVLNLE